MVLPGTAHSVSCLGKDGLPNEEELQNVLVVSEKPSGSQGPLPTVEQKMERLSKSVITKVPTKGELPESKEGVYVGEGLPPVPLKVAKKIRRGEFVEMEELLPELCPATRDGDDTKMQIKGNRKITDVFT